MVFRNSLELEEKKILSKPILSIIAGNLLFLSLHLIVLINFIATNKFQWLEHMPRLVAVGAVPLIIIAVLLILTFYYRFYYFLDSYYKIRTGNEHQI
jgi:multisubunit Na+/H+ antiporter MnhF subunit